MIAISIVIVILVILLVLILGIENPLRVWAARAEVSIEPRARP